MVGSYSRSKTAAKVSAVGKLKTLKPTNLAAAPGQIKSQVQSNYETFGPTILLLHHLADVCLIYALYLSLSHTFK